MDKAAEVWLTPRDRVAILVREYPGRSATWYSTRARMARASVVEWLRADRGVRMEPGASKAAEPTYGPGPSVIQRVERAITRGIPADVIHLSMHLALPDPAVAAAMLQLGLAVC